MAISANVLLQYTFENFLGLIRDNITDPHTPARTKWIFGAFPEQSLYSDDGTFVKDDFPIIVIDSSKITSFRDLVFAADGTGDASLSVTVTVYSTLARQSATLADQVQNVINTNKSTLESTHGLFFDSPFITGVDSDFTFFDKVRVHFYTLTFNFKYTYVR